MPLTDDERSAAREKATRARTADTAEMPVPEAREFVTLSAITAAGVPTEGRRFYKEMAWLAASATEAGRPTSSYQSSQLVGSDVSADASGLEGRGLGFRDGDEYIGF